MLISQPLKVTKNIAKIVPGQNLLSAVISGEKKKIPSFLPIKLIVCTSFAKFAAVIKSAFKLLIPVPL
jgi:hypothetical protein